MFGESFFYLVGIYAFLWWFVDNFKSLFQILWNLLKTYIQPDKNLPLNEKFGNWAGKNSCDVYYHMYINEIWRLYIAV